MIWGPGHGNDLHHQYENQRENTMAAVCDICDKKPIFGMSLSHSHRRTKRRWNPNIQRIRVQVGGSTKRMNVCTRCIKAGKVTKPVTRRPAVSEG